MDQHLVPSSAEALKQRLDQREVLVATLEQLQKDLDHQGLQLPEPGPGAFEELRGQVLPVLEHSAAQGEHALMVVLYRVDIAESRYRGAIHAGGLRALAGEVVLRALQKVLTRLRFAGRY